MYLCLKYLCFWFFIMFVSLAQTGENQFISARVMKGRGGAVLCVLFGANIQISRKKNF